LPITGSWLSDLAIVTIPVAIAAMTMDRNTLHGLIVRRLSQALMIVTFGYALIAGLMAIANSFLS
jgi:hypothetical protein